MHKDRRKIGAQGGGERETEKGGESMTVCIVCVFACAFKQNC